MQTKKGKEIWHFNYFHEDDDDVDNDDDDDDVVVDDMMMMMWMIIKCINVSKVLTHRKRRTEY